MILDEVPSKLISWAGYFPAQMTDGYAIYMDAKRNTEYRNTIFQRRSPTSDECNKFQLDDVNIEAMIKAMEAERYVNTSKLIVELLPI